MRILFISFIAFIAVSAAYSQKIPQWQTEIYFEDVIGNRDTIVIGHDADATSDIDAEFGEIEINEPWDSVFEIRSLSMHRVHSGDRFYSKTTITKGELPHQNEDCSLVKVPIVIAFNVRNPPLIIRWNTDDFRNACYSKTSIITNYTPLLIPPWYENEELLNSSRCMAEDSSFKLDSFYQTFPTGNETTIFSYLQDQIEGRDTLDSLNVVLFHFVPAIHEQEICPRIVDLTEAQLEELNVYPNPTDDQFNIEGEIRFRWVLYNMQGKFIKKGNSSVVNTRDLGPGVYNLNLIHKSHRVNRKIVVH